MLRAKERIKALLARAKRAVGIEDNVRLILYPMKYKVASVSLKSRIIRVNRNLLELFDDDELYYILVHELIHIKNSTINHGSEFYNSLYSLVSPEEVDALENGIVKKLMDLNIRTKKWMT